MAKTKLQKQLSRKVKGKKYPKYVVTIPPKYVKELGWQSGIELIGEVADGTLVLKPQEQTDEG